QAPPARCRPGGSSGRTTARSSAAARTPAGRRSPPRAPGARGTPARSAQPPAAPRAPARGGSAARPCGTRSPPPAGLRDDRGRRDRGRPGQRPVGAVRAVVVAEVPVPRVDDEVTGGARETGVLLLTGDEERVPGG